MRRLKADQLPPPADGRPYTDEEVAIACAFAGDDPHVVAARIIEVRGSNSVTARSEFTPQELSMAKAFEGSDPDAQARRIYAVRETNAKFTK